jgi:hypothetical protein
LPRRYPARFSRKEPLNAQTLAVLKVCILLQPADLKILILLSFRGPLTVGDVSDLVLESGGVNSDPQHAEKWRERSLYLRTGIRRVVRNYPSKGKSHKMTKGEIIENVLKEMRATSSHVRRRLSEEDEEEQNVINHLEKLLRDAEPGADILTCADFIDRNVECCGTCHNFIFPYDMCSVVKLGSGEYAWICCAIGRAVKNGAGGKIPVKRPPHDQPAKSMGYKPFAEFFGGKSRDSNDAN